MAMKYIFFKEKRMRKKTIALAVGLFLVLCLTVPVFAGPSKDGKASGGGTMTIEMYNVASNYTGIQPGWFGKMLKDKFDIELNVIAPQVSGAALYQTRTAAGNLGDIVVLDNSDFLDCIKAGLILDISGVIGNYKNLAAWDNQIKTYNRAIPNAGTKIYGIPCQMTNTSPTSYSEFEVYSSPWLPWNFYVEAGAPTLRNMNDLLDVLEKIQKAHPRGVDGNPAYAISLWPDWDVTSNEIINQTVKWYGVEVASGQPTSSVLLDTNNKLKSLTDDNGEYLKMLKFFNAANRRGLVDPDSGTQQWDQMVMKMQNRRVYLWWYSWQRGFWNSTAKGNSRENFIPIPVGDMFFFQDGDSYFGDGRVFGVGSKVDAAKRDRIMALLDWLASPEGLDVVHNGIKGFNYKVLPDGTYERTPEGERAFSDATLRVPAENGGGVWNDGNSWINQWIAHAVSINPLTKYPYSGVFWPKEIEKAQTTTQKECTAKFGAANQVDYLKKNNQIGVVPKVNVILPSDPSDIALIRNQCATITKDASWKMIFARNDADFNKLWTDMKTQLNGFGWEKLVQYDTQKFQAVVNARLDAIKNAK
jgi:multiple sugar transport system substrate-binding protein/putative aldouronate transport system substrate-binding protein